MEFNEVCKIIFGITAPPKENINIELPETVYNVQDPFKATKYMGVTSDTLAKLIRKQRRLSGMPTEGISLNGVPVTTEDIDIKEVVPISYTSDEAFYKFHMSKAFCDILITTANILSEKNKAEKLLYKYNFFKGIMTNLFMRNFFVGDTDKLLRYRYAALLPKGKGIFWYYNVNPDEDSNFQKIKENPNDFIKEAVDRVLKKYRMYFLIDDNSPHIILFKTLLAISAFTLGSIIEIEPFIFYTDFSYLTDLNGKQYKYCINTSETNATDLYAKSKIDSESLVHTPNTVNCLIDTDNAKYILLDKIKIEDICKVVQCICPFVYTGKPDNILNFFREVFEKKDSHNLDMFAVGSNKFIGCALSQERTIVGEGKTAHIFSVRTALKYFSLSDLEVNPYSVSYYNLYELIQNTFAENSKHVDMCAISVPTKELDLDSFNNMKTKYFLSPDKVGQLLTAAFYGSEEANDEKGYMPYPPNMHTNEACNAKNFTQKDKYLSMICKMLSKHHYKFKDCCAISDLKFILDFREEENDNDTLNLLNTLYNQFTVGLKYYGKSDEHKAMRSKLVELLRRVWVGVAPSEKISNRENVHFYHTPFCPGYPEDLSKYRTDLNIIIPLLSVYESIEVQKHADYQKCVAGFNPGIFITPEYILPLIERDNLYSVGLLSAANIRYIKTNYSQFHDMSTMEKYNWITSNYFDNEYCNPYFLKEKK